MVFSCERSKALRPVSNDTGFFKAGKFLICVTQPSTENLGIVLAKDRGGSSNPSWDTCISERKSRDRVRTDDAMFDSFGVTPRLNLRVFEYSAGITDGR
jgi:hypothetical protein